MEFVTIVLIAIGLSFDTFAVSITNGVLLPKIKFWNAVELALVFAIFQGLMPLCGWLIGSSVKDYVQASDHWIAFGLLVLIGGKMIWESLKPDKTPESVNIFSWRRRIAMGVATSIDALVVGFSLVFLQLNICVSLLVIAFVTFVASMLGMLFGKKLGLKFGHRMEIIGGLILIAIGAKILIEHLMNGV